MACGSKFRRMSVCWMICSGDMCSVSCRTHTLSKCNCVCLFYAYIARSMDIEYTQMMIGSRREGYLKLNSHSITRRLHSCVYSLCSDFCIGAVRVHVRRGGS